MKGKRLAGATIVLLARAWQLILKTRGDLVEDTSVIDFHSGPAIAASAHREPVQ
jgi:hypothetical protein